jgi:glycosyltransferase involved in cell wall biosynthesis
MPNQKLVIIGDWDYKKELQKLAKKNIVFVWKQYWDDLVALVQNSLGLIFPWEEDFWMVPVEVMSAWLPVFALAKWWLLETVIAWETWEFFNFSNWIDFINNFEIFHQNNLNWKYKSENCKKQAENFSKNNFIKELKNIVNWQ